MKEAFQRMNSLMKADQNVHTVHSFHSVVDTGFKPVKIEDFKIDPDLKQLNLLVKCRLNGSTNTVEKWITSEQMLDMDPQMLTDLLILKTNFGVGYIDPKEVVMKK